MLSLHLEMAKRVLAPFRCWGAQPVRTNAGRSGLDSKLACFPPSMWAKLIALVLVTSRIVRVWGHAWWCGRSRLSHVLRGGKPLYCHWWTMVMRGDQRVVAVWRHLLQLEMTRAGPHHLYQ